MAEKPLITHTYRDDLPERIEALLNKGYSPNAHDGLGQTPLMLAAGNGNADTVDLLLKFGADARHVDFTGQSALHFAAAAHNKHIPTLVFKPYPREGGATRRVPKRAFYESCISRLAGSMGDAIDVQDSRGRSALMEAIGYPAHVSALLSFRPRLDLRDRENRTALALAIEHGATECVDLLMQAGACE